jgi:hypothetical protein
MAGPKRRNHGVAATAGVKPAKTLANARFGQRAMSEKCQQAISWCFLSV